MIKGKRIIPMHFSKQWCEDIINASDELATTQAHIGGNREKNNKGDVNPNVRVSDVKWIDFRHKLYRKIQEDILHLVNVFNVDWGFDIYQSVGSLQYTVYPVGGKYDAHHDTFQDNVNVNRKISVSVLLSSDSEFDGGEFVLADQKIKNFRGQGSVLIFPSYMMHGVRPVTRGERKSLVAWVMGPAWR